MATSDSEPRPTGRVCPAAHGRWLGTPLRRLFQNPDKILRGLISEGQTVVDLGCGPGFFTIPMARLVGNDGCVIAVDLQEAMLEQLRVRAERAGVASRIRLHECESDRIGVAEQVDFVLAFYVLHETPEYQDYLRQVRDMLKPGGGCLLVEPKFHVSASRYRQTLEAAVSAGMKPVSEPKILLSRVTLLRRG
jgi:ubiquinone/menaquinone biosynthesis C-methylase UbiE